MNDLSATPQEPDQEVTLEFICEKLLADAKSGDLLALAFATITTREGKMIRKVSAGTGWGGDRRLMSVLGDAVQQLQKRFAKETKTIIIPVTQPKMRKWGPVDGVG